METVDSFSTNVSNSSQWSTFFTVVILIMMVNLHDILLMIVNVQHPDEHCSQHNASELELLW